MSSRASMAMAAMAAMVGVVGAAMHTSNDISAAPPPNILFVLADDLGYNEVNFNNASRGIITTNLDKLAHAGVILRNYYVNPICSPTRSALMTGRYTTRLGTQSSVIYWDTPWGIPLNETFVGQNLQDAGYHTALFGKWHLGMFKEEYMPPRRGFDEHMGYLQGCGSAWTHISSCCTAGSPDADQKFICPAANKWGKEDFRGYDWWKTGPAPNNHTSTADLSTEGTNSAFLIRDAAVEFIGRVKKPWFLYLPFQNIHSPYTTDIKYRNLYKNDSVHTFTADEATMFGYLSELDDMVGDIIAQIKSVDATDNTVVIFSSDNGAPPAGEAVDHAERHGAVIARNYPFRGWKTQIWDGGTRVAGFISSPLLPKSVRGTISHGLFHVTDWLPTIAAIAGASTVRNQPLDGHNMWSSIAKGGPSPRTEMLYNINPYCTEGQAGPPKAGLRVGSYKILCYCYSIAGIDNASTSGPFMPENVTDKDFANGPCVLYDLDRDPSESTDISPALPAKVKTMLARLLEFATESAIPQTWDPPYQGESYYCKDCPKHPGGTGPLVPWGPWL